MITTAVIIFRELLEISIVLGIINVATDQVLHRTRFIYSGVITGIIGSAVCALLFGYVTIMFSGSGQEIINSITLVISILLIGYTVVWMKGNSKLFSDKLLQASKEISMGKKPLYAISIIIASSIFREGTEIVLFLNGIIASGTSIINVIQGIILGCIMGLIIGFCLYKGIKILNYKYVFKVTSMMLIFLAASMASETATLLASANIVTVLSEPIWDTSFLLNEQTIFGSLLHTMIGYVAQPTGIQIVFYVTTILVIYFSTKIVDLKNS
jgi:high-affinity iron transporter